MIMQSAKITIKRQVTIPIHVMRKLGLNPGDQIIFEEKGDHIEVQAVGKKNSALNIIGKYPELSVQKITSKDIKRFREKTFLKKFKDSNENSY